MSKERHTDNVTTIRFLDLIDLTHLKTMIERFYDLTGLTVGVLDNEGNPLVNVGFQSICADFHRKNKETIDNCIESDNIVKGHLNKEGFISYKCKNGLNDMAFPLIVDGTHLATIYFGQFFYEDDNIDRKQFIKQAEKYKFDKEKYLEALDQVPVYSHEKVKKVLDFSKILAENIVYTASINLKLLENQKKKIYEINIKKDKFFSIISHDLRGPVGNQLQLLELIISEIDDQPIEELKTNLIKLLEYSKTTYNLIENLLEWAMIQIGKDKVVGERFNLKDLIEETISILKEHAYKKNITIYNLVKPGILAFAEKNSIFTILRNLISNAIKFTYEEGKIKIQAQRIDNFINISIEDNGVGMTKDQMNKLFNIESSSSEPGTNNETGTGIGLLLCKELITKNNGEIWVESEKGKGSIFYFSIPITKRD